MGEPNARQLAVHSGDILASSFPRVLPGGYRILLRGQAKSVIPHGVEDVLPLHPLEPSRDIGGDIA